GDQVARARGGAADRVPARPGLDLDADRVRECAGRGRVRAQIVAGNRVRRGARARQVDAGGRVAGDEVAGAGDGAADDVAARAAREADAESVREHAGSVRRRADVVAGDRVAARRRDRDTGAVPGDQVPGAGRAAADRVLRRARLD